MTGGWKADLKLREQAAGLRAEAQGQLELKSGDQYRMKDIDWLWPGWLARGKLHIIAGQKGAGKSTIAIHTLADLTSGSGEWPDRTPVLLQGDVLVWSGEDDIADTILPRFTVAGGDRRRIHFINGIIVDGVKRAFDPATDMPALLPAVQKLPNLVAIMIDPVVSATAGDSFKNAETRRGLQPLVDLAVERNIALIGITHFTKGSQGRDPIERITGSLAFGAVPRVVWAAAKGDSENGPRRLVRIASNIGPEGAASNICCFSSRCPITTSPRRTSGGARSSKGARSNCSNPKRTSRKRKRPTNCSTACSSMAPSRSTRLNKPQRPTTSHGQPSNAPKPTPNPSSLIRQSQS